MTSIVPCPDMIVTETGAEAPLLTGRSWVHWTYASILWVADAEGSTRDLWYPKDRAKLLGVERDAPGDLVVTREGDLPFTVHLYHGRDTTTEDLEDWGYPGPTYLATRLHITKERLTLTTAEGEIVLPVEADLVRTPDGKFYGDWEADPSGLTAL